MKRRTVYTETLDDGPEIEFEFEPIESTLLQAKVGDKFIVAYLVQDDGGGMNPLTDCDGNGTLVTYNLGVITDDNSCASNLGLEEFGSRGGRYPPVYDLDSKGVYELAVEMVKKGLTEDEEFIDWCRNEMEPETELEAFDYITFVNACFEKLNWHSYKGVPAWLDDRVEAAGHAAWEQLYAEGKIGEYLAVPVDYCVNNHGPGTTSIYTTTIDKANAVWIPGEFEISNMNFTGCTTYLEKLAVADKYAQSCLDEYCKWCNGEVYGCVVEVFDEQGKKTDDRDNECWSFIGWEWAEQALLNEFFDPACKRNQPEEVAA